MKLTEIMIIREDGLKLFQVDDPTLARLTRIRGNLFRDDLRLRTVAELPTMIREPQQTAELVYSQAAIEATERAVALYKMMRDAGERSRAAAAMPQTPQPERPLTPEETWRHDPALRAEFNNNINAYLAYCKAVTSGRCRIYGQGTSTR